MIEHDSAGIEVNFRAHHVNLSILENEAMEHEGRAVEHARSRSGTQSLLPPDGIEKIKRKKVNAQVEIGRKHNQLEDEVFEIRGEQEITSRELQPLEHLFSSDYTQKQESDKERLLQLRKKDKSLQKRLKTLHNGLRDTNRDIRGSQQMSYHSEGRETKDRWT